MDLLPKNIMYNDTDVKIIDFDNSLVPFIFPNYQIIDPLFMQYIKENTMDYGVDIFALNMNTVSQLLNTSFEKVL